MDVDGYLCWLFEDVDFDGYLELVVCVLVGMVNEVVVVYWFDLVVEVFCVL